MKFPMNKDELMAWAADFHYVDQNCEGSPEEALMAGWVNAMDVEEERKGDISDEEFIEIAYHEYINMGYEEGKS